MVAGFSLHAELARYVTQDMTPYRGAPAVSWVLPPALRALAGRSSAPVIPPDSARVSFGMLSERINRPSDDSLGLDTPTFRPAELRQLAAAAGARVVLVPSGVDSRFAIDGNNIVAELSLLLLDVRANKVLWSSHSRYNRMATVFGRVPLAGCIDRIAGSRRPARDRSEAALSRSVHRRRRSRTPVIRRLLARQIIASATARSCL